MSTPLLVRLRHTLTAHSLVTAGDRILVACSGGPDSLALLHALHALRDELSLESIATAHFNHQLRGAESAEDAHVVAAFCTGLGIACHVGQGDVAALAQERKLSIQQAARAARYAFLEETAQRTGATKIATGHTQDDQAETVLINILRGTGLDGLGGIPYRRDSYVRPLRDTSRAAVEDYCAEHTLTPRRDPSNQDPTHYTRNKLRLELLPQLERDYNPAVRDALLRLSDIAARDADYLAVQADEALSDVTMQRDTQRLTLDADKLRVLHPALQPHVLRAAFTQLRGTREGLTHQHLDPLLAAVHGRQRLPFGLTTPSPHCTVRVTPRRIILSRLSPS